jgi:hypothetical protein
MVEMDDFGDVSYPAVYTVAAPFAGDMMLSNDHHEIIRHS